MQIPRQENRIFPTRILHFSNLGKWVGKVTSTPRQEKLHFLPPNSHGNTTIFLVKESVVFLPRKLAIFQGRLPRQENLIFPTRKSLFSYPKITLFLPRKLTRFQERFPRQENLIFPTRKLHFSYLGNRLNSRDFFLGRKISLFQPESYTFPTQKLLILFFLPENHTFPTQEIG